MGDDRLVTGQKPVSAVGVAKKMEKLQAQVIHQEKPRNSTKRRLGLPAGGHASATMTSSLIGAGRLHNGAETFSSVVDARQAAEFRAGHIAGVRNDELGGLARHFSKLPAGPIVVMCRRGKRAMTAASIL